MIIMNRAKTFFLASLRFVCSSSRSEWCVRLLARYATSLSTFVVACDNNSPVFGLIPESRSELLFFMTPTRTVARSFVRKNNNIIEGGCAESFFLSYFSLSFSSCAKVIFDALRP